MGLRRSNCRICAKHLSAEEIAYYDGTCESCERDWSAHMDDWRTSQADDQDLDRLLSVPPDQSLH